MSTPSDTATLEQLCDTLTDRLKDHTAHHTRNTSALTTPANSAYIETDSEHTSSLNKTGAIDPNSVEAVGNTSSDDIQANPALTSLPAIAVSRPVAGSNPVHTPHCVVTHEGTGATPTPATASPRHRRNAAREHRQHNAPQPKPRFLEPLKHGKPLISPEDARSFAEAPRFDIERYLAFFPKLSPQAKHYIRASAAAPARHPNGRMSVTTRVPDRKTGVVITAESDEVELSTIWMGRICPEVLAVFDQPQPIIGTYQRNGRPIPFHYTPDFLILWDTGPEVVQARMSSRLVLESAAHGECVVPNKDGSFSFPEVDAVFAKYKLPHRLITEAHFNPNVLQGVQLLEAYQHNSNFTRFTREAMNHVLELVQKKPGLNWREVPADSEEQRADLIYHLLATRKVHTDLENISLKDKDRVRLFSTLQIQRAFALFRGTQRPLSIADHSRVPSLAPGDFVVIKRRRLKIVRIMPGQIAVQPPDGDKVITYTPDMLLRAGATFEVVDPERVAFEDLVGALTQGELEMFLQRLRLINPYLPDGAHEGESPKDRTTRRHLDAFRKMQKTGQPGERALIPQIRKRGYFGPRMNGQVALTLEKIIAEKQKNHEALRAVAVYGCLIERCKGVIPDGSQMISLRTVERKLAGISDYEKSLAEGGPRLAGRFRPPYSGRSLLGSKNGLYPFHIAHMDHSPVDIKLLKDGAGLATDRPWVSKLVDGFSGKILAFVLWFGAPRTSVVFALLLDCVRRHGTLAKVIRCDWGSEFRSTPVQTACASIGVNLSYRPKAKPRSGAPVESSFSSQNKR
ncbi:MAG TPA: DDE-type integrase/transposase/recombinase, partial [Rhizobium sp.]|nr:DDE-type integrase/transposase/recombinase [Rhizobium sp.]